MKFIILFLIFNYLNLFSQKKSYRDYPCSVEKWEFLNDSILHIKSGYSDYLYIYKIRNNTCDIKMCDSLVTTLYEKKLNIFDINIHSTSLSSSNGRNYLKMDKYITVVIRGRYLLIIYQRSDKMKLFLLRRNNCIMNFYYRLKFKIFKYHDCRGFEINYAKIMKTDIEKYFGDILDKNPNYCITH